jgi:hypothetical protein
MGTFNRLRKPPANKKPGWYKDCLRLDFEFRCAYCLIHEADYQSPEDFEVEHFQPISANGPEREYKNLYYSCRLCNKRNRKGTNWPTPAQMSSNIRFVDPCSEFWEEHVSFKDDGSIDGISDQGTYSVSTIDLNRQQLRLHRSRFPLEYYGKSLLKEIEQKVKNISSVVTNDTSLPQEIKSEIAAFTAEVHQLRQAIQAAWSVKVAKPPAPHCPH